MMTGSPLDAAMARDGTGGKTSQDHPSVARAGQTAESFLGVIPNRWGGLVHQNGVVYAAGQLVISPGPLTTWDRCV